MPLREKILRQALVFLALGTILSPAAWAQNSQYQVVKLLSGKQVKLIGVTAGVADAGQPKPMTLRYQTDRNITDRKALQAEVDDIWDMYKVEVEKAGMTTALIQANSQALGGDKFAHQVDFVLIKLGTGKWHCLNDEVVGVGTPAKIAYRQGLKLSKQGKVSEALAMFDKCVSLDPQYGPCYIDRCAAHLQLNQPEKAIADANTALTLLPENPGVYCNRGIAYWKLNQREKGLDDFSKAISLSPNDHLGYMNRGAALVEIGQYENGIADLTKAISCSPGLARPYHNRSVAYEKLAERDKQQALALGQTGVQTASSGRTH